MADIYRSSKNPDKFYIEGDQGSSYGYTRIHKSSLASFYEALKDICHSGETVSYDEGEMKRCHGGTDSNAIYITSGEGTVCVNKNAMLRVLEQKLQRAATIQQGIERMMKD